MNTAVLIPRIKARCVQKGECEVWDGANAGKADSPVIALGKKKHYVRRVVYAHKHGAVPDGHGVGIDCGTRGCVNEDHLVATTTSERSKKAGEEGKYSTLLRCAKIAAARRAQASDLTPEQVMDIRFGPGTTEEAGARYGICKSAAAHIRRGDRWKDYTSAANPFTGLLGRAA